MLADPTRLSRPPTDRPITPETRRRDQGPQIVRVDVRRVAVRVACWTIANVCIRPLSLLRSILSHPHLPACSPVCLCASVLLLCGSYPDTLTAPATRSHSTPLGLARTRTYLSWPRRRLSASALCSLVVLRPLGLGWRVQHLLVRRQAKQLRGGLGVLPRALHSSAQTKRRLAPTAVPGTSGTLLLSDVGPVMSSLHPTGCTPVLLSTHA